MIIKDNFTNTTVSTKDHDRDSTAALLELLRKRVPEMNIVNFFVAGTGRSGRVCKHAIKGLLDKNQKNVLRVLGTFFQIEIKMMNFSCKKTLKIVLFIEKYKL